MEEFLNMNKPQRNKLLIYFWKKIFCNTYTQNKISIQNVWRIALIYKKKTHKTKSKMCRKSKKAFHKRSNTNKHRQIQSTLLGIKKMPIKPIDNKILFTHIRLARMKNLSILNTASGGNRNSYPLLVRVMRKLLWKKINITSNFTPKDRP